VDKSQVAVRKGAKKLQMPDLKSGGKKILSSNGMRDQVTIIALHNNNEN
jgi:hypothetical protein